VRARQVLAVATTALLLGLTACSGASEEAAVPEGYQLVEHPLAEVALPATWTPRSTELEDPEAIQLQVPEVDEEIQVGAAVYQRGESAPHAEGVAGVVIAALTTRAEGAEQTDRREVMVDGAQDAYLMQWQAPSALFDEPVRFTVIAARTGDGEPVVVRLIGTEEHLPDDVIETALDTMRVTG
jgi:hypothetical protein